MINRRQKLLNLAWEQLWSPGSEHYAPRVLQNGGTFRSMSLSPLGWITLPDIGSLPLYHSAPRGGVQVQLSSIRVAGLPSIEPVSEGFSCEGASATATVGFPSIELSGEYRIEGSRSPAAGISFATTAPPAQNIDLAEQYRDKLVQSTNGMSLVSSYYDQNDTINWVLGQPNSFTQAWPSHQTNEHNTEYFMEITALAANTQSSSSFTVGDPDFQSHGYFMQSMLLQTIQDYQNNPPTDPESPDPESFQGLAENINGFGGYTRQFQSPMTVNEVMTKVQNQAPMSPEELRAVPEPEVARRARELAEREFPVYHQRALAQRAEIAARRVRYESRGRFGFAFSLPAVTLSGTLSGPRKIPGLKLTVLRANTPRITIQLLTGTAMDFTHEAQVQLDRTTWFQQLLAAKIDAHLGSPHVLSYLSNLFHQALLSISAKA